MSILNTTVYNLKKKRPGGRLSITSKEVYANSILAS